jgi:methionyl-tRNA synthetase
MSEKKSFYITTTLPYVNAEPHIGFAYELMVADVLARYNSKEREVFFNTGTDEHGLKIYQKAIETGKDPKVYVDEYAEKFKELKSQLGLSSLNFIRTTDENHKLAAQELWRRCSAKGDIYKKKYKGLYCVGDEMFMKESDLVDGRCPNHPNQELVEVEEENYFFKLSNYKKELKELLSREGVVVPSSRREEAIRFVENLEDISISREKSRLGWGIDVPEDDTQVMYVWFDALTNYISTLGWPNVDGNFKKFWQEGETVQLAGKDQIRFQSIIWQAMLFSAGVENTDFIFYHGFITSDGQKMSKSIGNVISPVELVDKYGTEATRYLLIKHVHAFEDTDITWERLDEWYNAHLVNGIGNLTSRIMKMASDYLDQPVEIVNDLSFVNPEWKKWFEEFRLDQALDEIAILSVNRLDEIIQKLEPFKKIKSNPEEAKEDLRTMVQDLWGIATLLEPFMPQTSEKILAAIKDNKKPENLFPRLNA